MNQKGKSSYKGNTIPKEWLTFLESQTKVEDIKNLNDLDSTDPFLKEALEGYSNETFSDIKDSLSSLESKIDARANITKSARPEFNINKFKPILYTGIAALLLIGSFFFIKTIADTQFNKTQVSDKKVNPTEVKQQETLSSVPSISDTVLQSVSGDTSSTKNSFAFKVQDSTSGENLIAMSKSIVSELEIEQNDENQMVAAGATTSSSVNKEEVLQASNRTLKGQVVDRKTNEPIAGVIVSVDGKNKTVSSFNGNFEIQLDNEGPHNLEFEKKDYETYPRKISPSNAPSTYVTIPLNPSFMGLNMAEEKSSSSASTNSLRTGLDLYSKGKYSEASKELDKAISINPENNDAIYYAGLSHFNAGRPGKSISYFDKIIKSNDGNLKEDAKWYKAQALSQKGFKDDAIKILEKIVSENGKYAVSAKSELSKLRP